jgi:hypothetical protein
VEPNELALTLLPAARRLPGQYKNICSRSPKPAQSLEKRISKTVLRITNVLSAQMLRNSLDGWNPLQRNGKKVSLIGT